VNSPEIFSQATRWLIELETTDRLEEIWTEFDEWFQSSAAHREAYARVRQAWIKLANSATRPIPELTPQTWQASPASSHPHPRTNIWVHYWWSPMTALISLIVAAVFESTR